MNFKNKNLYFVGGIVRDSLLGVESFDTDYCYLGNAIDFARQSGYEIIKTNSAFGTVRILFENQEIDIASTREESYPRKGHLPVIQNIGCSLEKDLIRRDFTVNALAKNTVTGEIVDLFGGIEDLKNKKLKVLHEKSFIDDPSRIIRGLKFYVRFGFELDEFSQKLQDEYLENINYDMSWHRIKKELKETFSLRNDLAYQKFVDQKIYKLLNMNIEIINSKTSPSELIKKYQPKNEWLVYLGNLNLDNLDLSGEELLIKNSYEEIKNIVPKTNFETYKLFKDLPIETVLIYAIFVNTDIAINYLENLSKIKLCSDGNTLKSLGILQGKIYKEIFDFLLEKKLENPTIDKEDEIELVKTNFCDEKLENK